MKRIRQIRQCLNRFISNHGFFLAVAFFIFISLLILVKSGAIYSGYHLADDHEILRIKNDLSKEGNDLTGTVTKWVKRDLNFRFRPFYFIHRIFSVYVLDGNFQSLSIYILILSFLTLLFFFFSCFRMGFNYFESLFFSFFTLVGCQFEIWWRLGPGETIGTFLLSLTLFFAVLSASAKRKRLLYEIFFLIFVVFTSLCKESFILMIPAIIMLKLYLSKTYESLSFYKMIKRNLFTIAMLCLVFLAEILFILSYIGTTKIGYAGVGQGTNLKTASRTFIDFFSRGTIPFWIVLAILLLIMMTALFARFKAGALKTIVHEKKKIFAALFFIFLILVPQIILYAKSGWKPRYLVPGSLAISVGILFFLKSLRLYKLRLSYLIALVFLSSVCLIEMFHTYKNAGSYADFGKMNMDLFSVIEKTTKPGDHILIASDPVGDFEATFSINFYLRLAMNRTDLTFYSLKKKIYNDFGRHLLMQYNQMHRHDSLNKSQSIKEFNLILLLGAHRQKLLVRKLTNHFFFDRNEYTNVNVGRFFMLIKKMEALEESQSQQQNTFSN